MSANASKFNAILLKSGQISEDFLLSVDGSNVPMVPSAKLLGVTIDDKLNFDEHVVNICKKASGQINAIARIAKFLNTRTLRMLYNSFINSNFLYCPNIWHFGLLGNFWKIEKANKRSLRVTLNDYTSSYPELLNKAQSNCIYIQNLHIILIECYKYINGFNPNILVVYSISVITITTPEDYKDCDFPGLILKGMVSILLSIKLLNYGIPYLTE